MFGGRQPNVTSNGVKLVEELMVVLKHHYAHGRNLPHKDGW